jgi:hypothetical protein
MLVLSGCMAAIYGTADQLNQISIGMPKEQVLKSLGMPKSTSASNGVEYLQYLWVKTIIAANANFPEDYYVAIQDGRVLSYGRTGDFESTKLSHQQVNQSIVIPPAIFQKPVQQNPPVIFQNNPIRQPTTTNCVKGWGGVTCTTN